MKVAICADLHARESDLAAFSAQWGALIDECERRDVDALLIAGDVFDSVRITDAVAAAVVGPLMRIVGDVQIYAIPGNHDYKGPRPGGALSLLAEIGCYNVNGPSVLNLWQTQEPTVPCVAFLPWINVPDRPATEILRELCAAPVDLLVGHVQVIGAKMNGGAVCDGEARGWRIARADLEALPVRHFALGDFHGRQDLTGGRGGYVGALRQLNFGEEGNPAGFEIWDSETNAAEWIELDRAPRYVTAKAKPGDSVWAPDANAKMRVQYEGQPDGQIVREMEAAGILVEVILPREDRVARGKELPPGALGDPFALLDLWGEDKGLGAEELAALHTLAAELV